MMVFKMSMGYRIFSLIIGIPMLVLCSWFLLYPFSDGYASLFMIIRSLVIGSIGILMVLYAMVSVFVSRLEVGEKSIRKIKPFSSIELPVDGIAGYLVKSINKIPVLFFFPEDDNLPYLKITMVYPERDKLLAFASERFTDVGRRR